MRFATLGSGSKGNATYIESGKTSILIDAGFSGKEIEKRLAAINRCLDDLDAIFVTHEHQDHIRGAGVLSRRCSIPLFANGGTFCGAEKTVGKVVRFEEFGTGETIEFQDLMVRSFQISHDAADPVAFVVGDGRVKLGCCTDTGKVSQLMIARLGGCNGLILECNHDPQMLKSGPYPPSLQQRVRSSHGHLCNEDSAAFLSSLIHPGLQQVVLAHLSETNNDPKLALETMQAHLPADPTFQVSCATQKQSGTLFLLKEQG
ncbi:MAG: MBL fold metallo-hydrolase [Thermodesulfobacteriota bacterium]